MNKEEYYKRIEKINNRFRTDRVIADEEYQLVCQRNYLSTKYIEHLEQKCKKQKEVINKKKYLLTEQGVELRKLYSEIYKLQGRINKAIEYLEEPNRDSFDYSKATLLNILSEVSE